ncbi:unannotated protein [freshwater metagenome]|uniref:Unannotated protein n=1 Tax=freshwater metagenome TaxID=449393 RepID=A0A6J7JL84_9ZZZZ
MCERVARRACFSMPAPPKTAVTASAREWAISRISSTICVASSRVGTSTRALGRGSSASMPSTRATPKAIVLPEPVGEATRTSRPARASGSASSWMANGDSMPRSASAVATALDTPRSAKVWDMVLL